MNRLLSCLAIALQLGVNSSAHCAESPATPARYQAKLFELIEADEAKYDPDFAKRFDDMLASYVKGHRNFSKRITSGAASDGHTLAAGGRSYVHYASCQAHQCDSTTLDVLFDPASKRMVAKVLDHCAAAWLGAPDSAEQALLEAQHRETYPTTLQHCGSIK